MSILKITRLHINKRLNKNSNLIWSRNSISNLKGGLSTIDHFRIY